MSKKGGQGRIPASLLNVNVQGTRFQQPQETSSQAEQVSNQTSSSRASFTQRREPRPPIPSGNSSESEAADDEYETNDSDDTLGGPFNTNNRSHSGSLNNLSQLEIQRSSGMTNVQQQFRPSALGTSNRLSPYNDRGLTGLRNIGNTCFMNSILQCLSNTEPLLKYVMINRGYVQDLNTSNSTMKGNLMKAFAKLVQDLWSPNKPRDVDTYSLKSQIQRFNTIFRGARQHDSQELLRFLLEGLHSDVNRIRQKPNVARVLDINPALPENEQSNIAWRHYQRFDNSKIADIFVGQLKSTLTCLTCGFRSVTFDPFWDLSLSIPTSSSRLSTFSTSIPVKLEQCLGLFTQEEILDGNEKPMCAKCKTRRKCTKKFSIQKFPEVLVIHLKRFTTDERGKLRTTVKFPISGLDMSPFGHKQHVNYNLYGISNHFGTAFSGHYIAYCKHPFNHNWSCYDDARVSEISNENLNAVEGYVLFYEMSLASKNMLNIGSDGE